MVLILFWLLGWLMDRRLAKSNKVLLIFSVCMLPAAFDLSYTLFVMGNLTLVNISHGIFGRLPAALPFLSGPQRACSPAVQIRSFSIGHNAFVAKYCLFQFDLHQNGFK